MLGQEESAHRGQSGEDHKVEKDQAAQRHRSQ
jgi:hypothetical protein